MCRIIGTQLGGLSSIWHHMNMNLLYKTFVVSKCLVCQQHTNSIAIMNEPITISQKNNNNNNDNNPSPGRNRTVMESRKFRRSSLLLSLFYMATENLQQLKLGHLEDRQQLSSCFKHQQMRDGYTVLHHSFRCDLYGAK